MVVHRFVVASSDAFQSIPFCQSIRRCKDAARIRWPKSNLRRRKTMHRNRSLVLFLAIVVALGVVTLSGCANTYEAKGPTVVTSASGKIPVTSASDDAMKEFLQGRDL